MSSEEAGGRVREEPSVSVVLGFGVEAAAALAIDALELRRREAAGKSGFFV